MAKSTVSKAPTEAKAKPIKVTPPPVTDEGNYEVEETIGERQLGVPGGIRKASTNVSKMFTWVYGPPKIGKTTFANHFPGVWFWASEPGQDWIDTRPPTIIQSWDHLLDLAEWVATEKPTKFGDGTPIKTIAWDTVDLIAKMCADHIAQELGVSEIGELNDRGKSWAKFNNEFERVFTKIRRWPFGMVCISHARQKPFKTKGREVDRWEPEVGAGPMRILSAAADLILYAHADEYAERDEEGNLTGQVREQRQLLCHPRASAVAGGRMSHMLPQVLPLDYDELMAYLTGKKTLNDEE